jgi:hypothetical protein
MVSQTVLIHRFMVVSVRVMVMGKVIGRVLVAFVMKVVSVGVIRLMVGVFAMRIVIRAQMAVIGQRLIA